MPYLSDVQGPALRQAGAKAGMSVATLLALSSVQRAVLLGICSRIGLWAARRSEFRLPIFDAVAAGKPVPLPARAVLLSGVFGLAGGALVVFLDAFVFRPAKALALNAGQPAAWKGFLASFYGGITEETFFRLFFLSLLVLGVRRLVLGRNSADRPLPWAAFWTLNAFVAVLFGLGHLPGTAALAPLTTNLVVRALVLNGVLALLFGELYRRWGFEMAIVAHFSADVALHVLPPLVG
ncbi:MAG TPA: CPBP family glutamic-type intramembrane protease [Croceibacterium sp.]